MSKMAYSHKDRENTQAAESHGSLKSYTIGFLSSIALTLIPYYMVTHNINSGTALVTTILGLAVVQLFVQLMFFLHLGKEARPYWNLLAFIFAVMVVSILLFGSLWIMKNLNRNMTSAEMGTFMVKDEGIKL
jgi:cytochrome o ubiquinol oxidase operon protein cyoD